MRSSYVYLIFQGTTLLSVHTVKYEAVAWFNNSGLAPDDVEAYRMHDSGMRGTQEELVRIPWIEFLA
jgi:hypothetical protein